MKSPKANLLLGNTRSRESSRPRPRILYTLPDGQQSSCLLRTSLFELLTQHREFEWVFLSPLGDVPEFVWQFEGENVQVVHHQHIVPSFVERQIEYLKKELLMRRLDQATQKILYERMRIAEPKRFHFHRRLVNIVSGFPNTFRELLDHCLAYVDAIADTHEQMDRINPDVVILGSGGLKISDVGIARWTQKNQVPSFSIIPSWDNLAIKGPTIKTDMVAVWNDCMREQAINDFGYSREDVSVVGTPLFDRCFRGYASDERGDFFESLGLDKTRKLITFTTIPPFSCNFNDRFIQDIAEGIRSNRIAEPAQLLVRLHPQDSVNHYEHCRDLPHVHFDLPGRYHNVPSCYQSIMRYDPTEDDLQRLYDTLRCSDVVVNIASTIALEACALNRPVVNVAYMPNGVTWPISIERYYDLPHYQPLVLANAVALAKSPTELFEQINHALRYPQFRNRERESLTSEILTYKDGRCADRLANAILEFAAKSLRVRRNCIR